MDAARASQSPFLGNLQGGLSCNTALDRFNFDLLTMLALYSHGEGHTVLVQLDAHISGGEEDTQLTLTYTHQFGVPAAQQWQWKGTGPRNDVRAHALAPVEREKRVIMDTREKVAAPAFASEAVTERVYEGEAFTHVLAVTGGALPLRYGLGGADAGRFTLSGATLQLPAQDYHAPADAGADNTYEATVTVTNRSARVSGRVCSEISGSRQRQDRLFREQRGD